MKTIRVLLLMALGWLALPASVWAFYNPSTGRWLSRDPIEEKGGIALFVFADNDGIAKQDFLGLQPKPPTPKPPSEPDVSWAPPPCPQGQKTVYIQVLYGGWGPYSGPRTDDGSAGFGSSPMGCPDYPLPDSTSGVFQDTPGGVTGPVKFIVCRVCEEMCCGDLWRIVSIGPCVYWKKGDKGDLYDPSFTMVDGPPEIWQVGLSRSWPAAANGECYKCKKSTGKGR